MRQVAIRVRQDDRLWTGLLCDHSDAFFNQSSDFHVPHGTF